MTSSLLQNANNGFYVMIEVAIEVHWHDSWLTFCIITLTYFFAFGVESNAKKLPLYILLAYHPKDHKYNISKNGHTEWKHLSIANSFMSIDKIPDTKSHNSNSCLNIQRHLFYWVKDY